MSSKEKQIKIRLDDWKLFHKVISYFVEKFTIKLSNATIVNCITKNITKEEIIEWTKTSLKN